MLRPERFDFGAGPQPLLGSPTLNVGVTAGGENINSVPDRDTIGIDVRTVPGQDHRQIQEELQRVLGERVDVSLLDEAAGVSADANHEWVQRVFSITKAVTGEEPVAKGATFFSDASVLTPAYGRPPTVILGPGEPSLAHKTDEFCLLSKLEQAREVYTLLAREWCRL